MKFFHLKCVVAVTKELLLAANEILILFTILTNKNIKEQKNEILNEQNLDELSKKTVAFIPHKGLVFGSKAFNIFEKSLYYSDNVNSYLNKYNILHLDYFNYPKPEENIC